MDFAAGGSRIPILTRNPVQSTAGFQTFGLPTGKTTGGSANRTTLGAMRMGDQDGNAPGSAIFAGDIFYPPGQPSRQYTEVTFQSTGNNVFQPETIERAAATEELIRRLGDNKFKAIEAAPFEDYLAEQKLAREVDDASRNAGLEDLGYSREIMRNLVAERRKGNEDDFLRRMLDAGMTQQEAQQEIENVRRANALQESRKVEDRTHQSKLLIQRIAKSRGILSAVNEPLTTTGAIENPQPNERMAQMSGQPENAYGSSPLDRDRVFKTPAYYNRMATRSAFTQEAGDEMAALANATAQATGTVPTPLMLEGLEREDAIERARDTVASRLDRVSSKRVLLPLPPIAEPFVDLLTPAYRGKAPGSRARFKEEEIQDLSAFHLFVALNQAIAIEPSKYAKLKRLLATERLTELGRETETPRRDIRDLLRKLTLEIVGTRELPIPFGGETRALDDKSILNVLQRIKGSSRTDIQTVESQMRVEEALAKPLSISVPPVTPNPTNVTQRARRAENPAPLAIPVPSRYTAAQLVSLTAKQLKNIAKGMGLRVSGTKATLIQRILDE
jgi:hypothetical protein